MIITKDADFSHRIAIATPPPRIVHIRVGNMRLQRLNAFLESIWPKIETHVAAAKLVNVFADRIEITS